MTNRETEIRSAHTNAVSLAHNPMAAGIRRPGQLLVRVARRTDPRVHRGTAPARSWGAPMALDVGCGTWFQSFLLARTGYVVDAFDVAGKLVEAARDETARHAALPLAAPPLLTSRTWRN